ncbi:MAG: MurR/RpiR family transcriptional regulator [Blautia sp.]|nr:MurR/RpiR family transcriptional regulator [Blautia sp.]
MNVLQNLTELYNTLPYDSTYRSVAKGILDNLGRMEEITIYDIAELTDSSRTTVWRMVQKMGYKSFSDFRFALQSAVSQYGYYNRMLPPAVCTDEEKLRESMIERMEQSARMYEELCSPSLMTQLVDELKAADKVHFYMPFRLGMVGMMQQNLAMSGKETAYHILYPRIMDAVDELSDRSIVIIATIEFAETLDMKNAFLKIKERGARIWLTGTSRTKYRKYADRMLLDVEADSFSWITTLEAMLLSLSELYRAKCIDY